MEDKLYLSKTRYCKAKQCPKMLWLMKNKPDVESEIKNTSVLDNGTDVGILAKGLFGPYVDIDFNSDLSVMIKDTKKALEKDNVIVTEASFDYNNNFCSVDLLKKNGENYEMYEVKSSTEVSDVYKDDVSYQYYVLKNCGLNVNKVYLVHLNSSYVRKGDLELNKLFMVEDLTDIAKSKYDEVENNIKYFNEYLKVKEEPNKDLDVCCFKPYECTFFEYCSRNLKKPNVFDIAGMATTKKIEYYHKGLCTFDKLINERLSDKYYDQINFEINNLEDRIDLDKIKDFLDTLSYPLYFLDFETFQDAVPSYDNQRPYMQVPFQYSLHYIENENGELYHTDFLADGNSDPRRALAEKLVKDIPMDVCTLAYNMSFEKGRIKEMADIFPDLSNHLMNIYNNMKDLMIPFKNHEYYSKDMEGSYSIKYVLPALFPDDPSLNYHNLDMVHNGTEAMNSYKVLSTLNEEDKNVLRSNMLKYCGLDTYAMVKIWEKLNEVVEEKTLKR